jgi:flagellar secretion chaperone FliS
MARNIAASYQKVQATTATPGQRVVMVYKALIKCLENASADCDSKEPERFIRINENIQRADLMIRELKMALDKKNGGELAENLDNLYAFWRRYLLKANMEKSKQKIEEVLKMIREMTEAWIVAERNVRTEQGQPPIPN